MKRKLIAGILSLCLLLVLFPMGKASAIPGPIKTEGNWQVGIDFVGGMRYTVLKYTGSATTVTVPKVIAGYQIDTISSEAFSGTNVKHLTLQDNIRYVGSFTGCKNLESITIYGSISNYLSTFSNCTNLKKVEFKGSGFEFEFSVFNNCTSLEEIVLPEGLTNISDECFQGCTNLKRITIPASVTRIGDSVFDGCVKLSEITVKEGNPDYCVDSRGVLYEQYMGEKTGIVWAPVTLSGHYDIHSGITSMADQAFAYCTALESVSIPAQISGISEEEFIGCTGLKKLNIQGNTSLRGSAFTGVNADVFFASGEHYRIENGTVNTGWIRDDNVWYYIGFVGANPTRITLPAKLSPNYLTDISQELDITLPNSGEVELCVPISNSHYSTVLAVLDEEGITPLSETWLEDEVLHIKLDQSCRLAPVINTTSFPDVGFDFWARDQIDYMTTRGLLSGKMDGTFAPTEVITRKTVAMILWRVAGRPYAAPDTQLTDVNLADRYTQAICWAEDAGIITGYEDGTFRGDDTLTRQHFAVMLYRFANYTGITLTPENDILLSNFPDHAGTYRWAQDAMQWAVSNGLINGRANGALDPQGNTTRAQLAVIMTRFLQKYYAAA